MATEIAIDGADFLINGRPTYEGRSHDGRRIEGLLLNSRMVQATFDDECAETRGAWPYPDTGVWDPERNTDEFVAMLPTYHAQGLRAVTIGLQGGGSVYTRPLSDTYLVAREERESPLGFSAFAPAQVSAFARSSRRTGGNLANPRRC